VASTIFSNHGKRLQRQINAPAAIRRLFDNRKVRFFRDIVGFRLAHQHGLGKRLPEGAVPFHIGSGTGEVKGRSQIEYVKQQARQEQINDEDDYRGFDECGNRRAAHALSPAFDTESLIAAHGGDDESENNWFRQGYADVAENKCIDSACPELFRTDVQCEACDQKAAQQSSAIPQCHQYRQG
jgi:hypothetical protein